MSKNGPIIAATGVAIGAAFLLLREGKASAKKPPAKPQAKKRPAAKKRSTAKKRPPSNKRTPKKPPAKHSYWNPAERGKPQEIDPDVMRWTQGFVWPIENEPRAPWRKPSISDHYRFRTHLNRWHNGPDIMYKRQHARTPNPPTQSKWHDMWPGTRVIAVGPGRVSVARRLETGLYVRIWHPHNLVTQYLHLAELRVKKGDTVKAGQIIGTVGESGGLYHLHFELWKNGTKPLDPAPYLVTWGHVGRRPEPANVV